MAGKGYRIGIDIRKIEDYGIGTYIQNLLREMPYDQKNAYILIGNNLNLANEYLKANVEYINTDSKGYSLKELISIPFITRNNRLDLFYSPHYVVSPFISSQLKIVVTIHDIIHLLFPQYLSSPLAYYYAKVMLSLVSKRADKIITDSKCSKQDLISHLKVPPEKIEVIYCSIDPIFSINEPRKRSKHKYDSIITKDYFLYVGNFKPHKNIKSLIEVFNCVYNKYNKEYELILVGGLLDEHPDLEALIKKYSLSGVVKSLGYVPFEDLPSLYSNAALFIYLSLYEGFGLPPLEAMACGVPTIVSNRSCLPEIVADAAILVDPYDVDNIVDSISSVLADHNLRDDLIAKGIKRTKFFSWKEMAEKVAGVYNSVLDN